EPSLENFFAREDIRHVDTFRPKSRTAINLVISGAVALLVLASQRISRAGALQRVSAQRHVSRRGESNSGRIITRRLDWHRSACAQRAAPLGGEERVSGSRRIRIVCRALTMSSVEAIASKRV